MNITLVAESQSNAVLLAEVPWGLLDHIFDLFVGFGNGIFMSLKQGLKDST